MGGFEVLATVVVGVAVYGEVLTVRACLTAMREEHAGDAERRLVRGLRTTGAAMFSLLPLVFVWTMAARVDRVPVLVYAVAGWVAFALLVYLPLIRRVWKIRGANGWSQWPSRVPL